MKLPLPAIAAHWNLLRRDITFLNHGSFGACPQPVFETYQRWQRELEMQPVEFIARRQNGLLAEARMALGAYLGVAGDDLIFAPNVTHALNIVAHSLRLEPGDEVLGNDHEYGAIERVWRYHTERQGAHYVNCQLPLPLHDPQQIVDTLWAHVTPRTRVIAVSHITSPTALIFPVTEICRRARAAGIITVVDGAHAPGQIALDAAAIDADFYGGNCHKWLCAPKSAGFLYARPEHQAALEPLVVSWGWRARVPGGALFREHFDYTGTSDVAAYLSVPAAIAFQHEHDWPAVRAACHALLRDARGRVAALTGLPPICPDDAAWFGQVAALPLPAAVEPHLARLCPEFGIEIPTYRWNEHLFARVSIQAYNTPADVDRLVAAVAQMMPQAV